MACLIPCPSPSADELREEVAKRQRAIEWLLGSDVTFGSAALIREALGIKRTRGLDDPSDKRVISNVARALRVMPWTLPALDRLASQSGGWSRVAPLIRKEAGL